jgi:hypothetical protein
MGDRRDWLTVLLRRLEFPFADCLNGLLIEAHPDALGNLDVLGFPSLIDDELNQDYAVDLRLRACSVYSGSTWNKTSAWVTPSASAL